MSRSSASYRKRVDQELADTLERERVKRRRRPTLEEQLSIDGSEVLADALIAHGRFQEKPGTAQRIAEICQRAEFADDYSRQWHFDVVMRMLGLRR